MSEETATAITTIQHEDAWAVDFDENVEKATDMIYQAAMLYEQLDGISGYFDDALDDLGEEDLNGPAGDALARPQRASHRALDLLVAVREMWGLEGDDPRYVEITKRANEDFTAQQD